MAWPKGKPRTKTTVTSKIAPFATGSVAIKQPQTKEQKHSQIDLASLMELQGYCIATTLTGRKFWIDLEKNSFKEVTK